jgi:hypothetical protein
MSRPPASNAHRADAPLRRRDALGALLRWAVTGLVVGAGTSRLQASPAAGHSRRVRVTHPDPRPGITATRVLPDERVPAKAREAYRAARACPEVLDGLYCHCDCAARDGLRSLLSCFEGEMPLHCGICQGEAKLAAKLAKRGKSLTAIRAAVDDEYGDE